MKLRWIESGNPNSYVLLDIVSVENGRYFYRAVSVHLRFPSSWSPGDMGSVSAKNEWLLPDCDPNDILKELLK